MSGSTVTNGSAVLLVVAVGENSQLGQLMGMLTQEPEPTPLQQKLEGIAREIGLAGLIAATFTLLALVIQYWILFATYESGEGYREGTSKEQAWTAVRAHLSYVIVAITVVVVAVPEGLPLAVTLSLAFAINKMLRDQNFVRRLAACETMGGANEICSDKTGTLTKNRMTVQAFWDGAVLVEFDTGFGSSESLSDAHRQLLLDAMSVNSSAYLSYESVLIHDGSGRTRELEKHNGNPTECSMLAFVKAWGGDYDELRRKHKTLNIQQFTSDRKMMTTVVKHPTDEGSVRVFVKGAAERVFRLCTKKFSGAASSSGGGGAGVIVPLTIDQIRNAETQIIKSMATHALRTITIAYKDIKVSEEPNYLELNPSTDCFFMESDLVFLGIAGIRDPVRDEVPAAVARCQSAGITVRMVTGDNIDTAKQIALKCGIYQPERSGMAMLGKDFNTFVGGVVQDEKGNDVLGNPTAFDSIVDRLQVLARSQPADKYTLVVGLRNRGQIVAVTGDGTNDAPALKKADVGFAMGLTGKEVAKQAADIVLLDDNFESIIKAVMWGRSIYDNTRRFIQFQITVNIVAVTTASVSAIVLKESPLTAVQLLWVNLIMDTFASLALSTEPPDDSLLDRPPHSRKDYLINKTMMRNIIAQAVFQQCVLFVLIFAGETFLPEFETVGWSGLSSPILLSSASNCEGLGCVRSGRPWEPFSATEDYSHEMFKEFGPSRHFTIVFNTFVFMQLFNMLNSRKIDNTINVFKGVIGNKMWMGIVALIVVLQVFIIQFGGLALSVHYEGLSWQQWLICIALGSGSLLVAIIVKLIPRVDFFLPQVGLKEVNPALARPSASQMVRGRTTSDQFASRLQASMSRVGNSPLTASARYGPSRTQLA
eukprot:GHVL01003643.1.p1 GENE.GHVL01003643.1~~GHVL01003643.1.p1  ORF type:complete len:878 (-),score=127.53 GHVL01003643.1:1661-4294(-)